MRHTQSVTGRQCLTFAFITGAVICAFSNCADATAIDRSGTLAGPTVALAGGFGHAYVTLNRDGIPTHLGVALTEAALTGLPETATETVFALPPEASATPYTHAVINWQPVGHPPAMIYTVPHFDVHFYSITQPVRNAIVLGDSILAAKMIRQPAAEFIPVGYTAGMASPGMGMHWNDPAAPERMGQPFTKTFIYGSYDGVFVFAEPMVTKAYLETKPTDVVTSIKLPAQYATHGYQATSYTVSFDAVAKEYRVALSGLVLR